MPRTMPLLLCLATVLAVGFTTAVDAAEFTQKPEVQTSITLADLPAEPQQGDAAAEGASPKRGGETILKAGPKPTWIWGANEVTNYLLRKTFDATETKNAWLQASCDNKMVLYLNGKRIAASSEWQTPITIDIASQIKAGENVLMAEVANQGGQAGFVAKLAIQVGRKPATYIVSDDTWEAAVQNAPTNFTSVKTFGKMGVGPWNDIFAKAGSTVAVSARAPRDTFQTLPGFQVEKLFTVPKDKLGSWVCLTTDHQGRLLASDQGKLGICRITPPPIGSDSETKVEPLKIGNMSGAQGMLAAFDSLYFSVNGGPGSGFYRAKDTNNDDQYDELVKLKALAGGGEHGPHALRLSPDGKSIYLIAGNHTNPPGDFDSSRVPKNWSEDLLLPRQWDARGHARGKLAPGGWIAKTDPEGKTWEMFSTGFRNPYDMDFNADGELFAYDADMEWDMGMPWYRPTRVVHATSGSEFGWRSGTGKWPSYYEDSLPQLVNVGPGSPVGATFGYGAKFPAKYQKAFYILDWTFGTMYAIHIEPDGSSYKATKEEFVSRTPLPLTDAVVGKDGALYFTIGGRGTQSELFRVTYVGDEKTEPTEARDGNDNTRALRQLRHQLEALHAGGPNDGKAQALIMENLGHNDRHIRYAARVALEHRDAKSWQDRALTLDSSMARIQAAMALARQGERSVQAKLLDSLGQLELDKLNKTEKLALIRAYALAFIRLGEPSEEVAAAVAKRFDPLFPSEDDELNAELVRLLVYVQSKEVVGETIALMNEQREPTQSDIAELIARNQRYGGTIAQMLANMPDLRKLHFAFVLRNAKQGWTVPDSTDYFRFLQASRSKKGGASYQGFITNMENDAFANASDIQRLAVEAAGLRKPQPIKALPKPVGPGHAWTLDEILAVGAKKMTGRNFENGKRSFAAARCVVCHRFGGEGGATGPDLTQAAGRFTLKDLAESIVDPSKVISDQYRATNVETEQGKVYTGRLASENEDSISLLTDPEDSTKVVEIDRKNIFQMQPSKSSIMPADLLKPLNEDEVLDMLAYLLSRGNKGDAMFKK